ncbi:MAG: 4Fe-4S dicluster domain-containing protein, partial [Alphaproteobacteria bacterium]|nr:4Fe-4S dicluster domain-containing protein [Alphaproteobacteria bacterium]
MHTNFSNAQLKNARIREADEILKRCVHCGLCTAVCPTYVLLGDERDSPRGRIYLIKDMFERKTAPTAEVRYHVDRCLSCLSCMTTCPSAVDYMHLVDLARNHIADTGHRSIKSQILRWLLATVLPHPRRFHWALRLVPFGRPLAPVLSKIGLKEVAAMLELAPREVVPSARFSGAGTAATTQERRARVILPTGCVQKVVRPDINDATIRLLARRGIDVVVAHGDGCCGALVHHMGREAEAMAQAKRNINAWIKE